MPTSAMCPVLISSAIFGLHLVPEELSGSCLRLRMDTVEIKVLVTPVLPTRISTNRRFCGKRLCTGDGLS
jgi:hypothetical protein